MQYYDEEKNLVTFSNSILKHFGVKTYHPSIPEFDEILKKGQYKKIVLFLFDGLGTYIQNLHLKEKDAIIKKRIFEITSVFPPTTVAATTALLSAKYPVETGWLGWNQYFPQIDKTVDMFSGRNSFTRETIEPHPSKTYVPYTTIFDRLKEEKDMVAEAVYPKGIENGSATTMKESLKQISNLLNTEKETFIYHYCTNPDHVIHLNGVQNRKVHRVIKDLNRKIVKFAKQHQDTLIIVLADHGLIDCENLFLDEHKDFYDLLIDDASLDARAAFFRIKDFQNNAKTFETLFQKYYGNDFILYKKEEILEKKIFGLGTPHPLFENFLGDYLAIAKTNKRIVCPKKKFEPMIGAHSGGTEEEQKIFVSLLNR